MKSAELIEVEIVAVNCEARDINSYELRRPGGEDLPEFSAGAHIDLHLPNGLRRSYSLCNSQRERNRYLIAVAKHPDSRGGSRFVHDALDVGTRLAITPPANHFPLDESAPHSVLIAGGIGVTPLLGMAQRLQELGRSWELFYCSRDREHAAFLDLLSGLDAGARTNVHLHFDAEQEGRLLDMASVVARAPAGAHLYCCGPQGMLGAFELATASHPKGQAHVEYFSPKVEPVRSGGFTVVFERSGKEVFVEEGATILDAALRLHIDTRYSCMEGVCGECIARVISGVPDHHDVFLSADEHASNEKVAICCSGSKSEKLVLDL